MTKSGIRFISLMLMVTLIVSLNSTMTISFAEDLDFDVSFFESRSDLFRVDYTPAQTGKLPYIETLIPNSGLMITHDYSSHEYYSYARTKVCLDYSDSWDPFPLWCIELYISTHEKPYNISSVEFLINGKSFVFTDLYRDYYMQKAQGSYIQTILIFFGSSNIDYLIAMEEFLNEPDSYEAFQLLTIPIIMYGDKTIHATLEYPFCVDFLTVLEAMKSANGVPFQHYFSGSDMKCN